jgi:hypothetical protein
MMEDDDVEYSGTTSPDDGTPPPADALDFGRGSAGRNRSRSNGTPPPSVGTGWRN